MGAEPSLEDVQAVVDTNVMFDIASCHDLSTSDEDDVNSVVSVYRRQRARDAVILAMLFDRDKVTTFNLWGETAELFHKIVDPSDNTSIETIFTTTFAHFTKDFVLPDWTMAVDPASQAELRSNAADQALVDIAKARGVPLITSEGFAPAGLYEAKIIKKARAAGVTVMTPRRDLRSPRKISVRCLLQFALFVRRLRSIPRPLRCSIPGASTLNNGIYCRFNCHKTGKVPDSPLSGGQPPGWWVSAMTNARAEIVFVDVDDTLVQSAGAQRMPITPIPSQSAERQVCSGRASSGCGGLRGAPEATRKSRRW
jgi:hypothetical protein